MARATPARAIPTGLEVEASTDAGLDVDELFLGDASRQVADTVRQTVDDVATKAEETLDETEQKVTAGSN